MDLADAVDVDDGGAVDAEEVAAVELLFDLIHRLAEEVGGGAGVQSHVVVGGFDPVDLGGVDDDRFSRAGIRKRVRGTSRSASSSAMR